MKITTSSILFIIFGVISAEYVGPQNGNGNGNAYGVPTDSITPPQPQGGPYPPSGWKPAGPRLLLPGEARSAQPANGNGFGQPPPPQYGPVSPVPSGPSGPSIDNQYGPAPPNNQYIPGSGFGNGNGHNGGAGGHGNGGNGHNSGNGGNGNGHNGGNGHNAGNGGNGNGHNGGNGFSNGNGNGNGHNGNGVQNGNGNGNGGGNGFTSPSNGNGFSNGNGHNGNGNGNGAVNGNGSKNGNGGAGSNGFSPAFHGAFPGVVYPFVQHSVPAVLAFRPGNGAGHGSIYPLYQVSISPPQSGTGVIDPSLFSLMGAYPTFQTSLEASALGAVHPGFVLAGAHHIAGTQPAVVGQGTDIGLIGHRLEPYYTLLTNHQSQKSQTEGIKSGLSNFQLQYATSQPTHGNLGVPVSVF